MTRIKKYGEGTVLFARRVPESALKAIDTMVSSYLERLLVPVELHGVVPLTPKEAFEQSYKKGVMIVGEKGKGVKLPSDYVKAAIVPAALKEKDRIEEAVEQSFGAKDGDLMPGTKLKRGKIFVTDIEGESFKDATPNANINLSKKAKEFDKSFEGKEVSCGCYLDSKGFLRRGGGSICKKSREEHEF